MNCEVSRVGEGGSEEEETMISRDTGPLRGMDYSQIAWHRGFPKRGWRVTEYDKQEHVLSTRSIVAGV